MAGRLTEEQRQEIVRRYEAGESLRQLGSAFGVSHETIRACLKQQDVRFRPRGLSAEELRKRRERWRESEQPWYLMPSTISAERWRELYWGPDQPSVASLARQYHWGADTVRKYLDRAGIRRRSHSEQAKIDLQRGRRPVLVGRSAAAAAEHIARVRPGWHPGLISPEAIAKRASAQRRRVGAPCWYCGSWVERRPSLMRRPRVFCNLVCSDRGRGYPVGALRPRIADRLRDLLREHPYKALPFTRATLEKAAATIGAEELEILEVLATQGSQR